MHTQTGGIDILRLKGSRSEMASHYGQLVKDSGRETALEVFSEKILHSVEISPLGKKYPFLMKPLGQGLQRLLFDPLSKQLTESDWNVMRAFSKSSGVELEKLVRAQVIADAGQNILNWAFGKKNSIANQAFSLFPQLGCTSFCIADTLSSDGYLHARNLDYEGYGNFDRWPAVLIQEPTDSPMKWVSFSSFGLPNSGVVTSINEKGIIVDIHQMFMTETNRSGRPILSVTDELARSATDLESAVQFLRQQKYASPWTLIVSSVFENRSLGVEVTPLGVSIDENRNEDFRHDVNHLRNPHFKKFEFFNNYRYFQDTHWRFKNVGDRFKEDSTHDIQSAVDLISTSKCDREIRSLGGIPSRMNNVQSIVLAPKFDRAFVGVPQERDQKPMQGKYVSVSLELFDAQENNIPETLRSRELPPEPIVKAHTLYRRAARLINEEANFSEACQCLVNATELDSKVPFFWIARAVVELKLDSSQEGVDRALKSLHQAQSLDCDPYNESLVHLFRARCLDLQSKREEAIEEYSKVTFTASTPLVEAVHRGVKSPYRSKNLGRIVMDFSVGDFYRF